MDLVYVMALKKLQDVFERVQELWPKKESSAESNRLLRAQGK